MSTCEELKKVAEFFGENELILKSLMDMFGETVGFHIMKNITRNKRLFQIYKRADCIKFMRILDALKQVADGNVLIYFAELQLYGIFHSAKEYYDFTVNITDVIEDEVPISVTPYQIVLSGHK